MKKYLYIVLLFGVCFGQSKSEPIRNEVITERHDNGLKKLVLVYEGQGINESLTAKYGFYDNGLKAFIETYKNNIRDGQSVEWYENGMKNLNLIIKIII